MLSRWYRALPGPPAAKVIEAILIVVVLLVLVAVAFEYLGRLLLDDGGVIG